MITEDDLLARGYVYTYIHARWIPFGIGLPAYKYDEQNNLVEVEMLTDNVQLEHLTDLGYEFNTETNVLEHPDFDSYPKYTIDYKHDPVLINPESKYTRIIQGDCSSHRMEVDVYDVLKAFDVTCPALQHLVKKALCAGLRGHKDKSQDLQDIVDSAVRAKQLGDKQ